MQHRCDDCDHSFFVPGQNGPQIIGGGCPECGGNARPEPDQPSPTTSDGDLRDMVDPFTGDDSGGNPLQEGILGTTDGGWNPARNRDESFASVRTPATEYVIPMHSSLRSSNQEPTMPWEFEVEEVAEPGLDNEEAEKKMNEKTAFLPAVALGVGAIGRALAPSVLRAAAPSLLRGVMTGGGNASMPPMAAPAEDARPMETIAKGPDLPGGGTPDDFPVETEDPETVDPKEHNDGATDGTSNDISVNDIGGTADATPGLEALEMMLPLVLHYHDSDDSGSEHPLIAALHQLLQDEGHLDGPDDEDALRQVIEHHKGGGESEVEKLDSGSLPKADGPSDDSSPDRINQPSKTAANHQGPHSPEQIAAVQQYLMDAGRTEEVPNVPMAPWDYADVMAEVANKVDQPPQDVGAQPMPAQEEAPPEDTMPMPGMTAPPPGQFAPTSRTADHDHSSDPLQGIPAADQLGQEDRSMEQDSSGAWQTDTGEPLIVGEQYEMHTPGVDIPDIVKVQMTKPDSVTLEFTGAYELGFAKEVTRQEFETQGYTFTHVRGDQPEANSPVEEQQPVEPDASAFSGAGTGSVDENQGHNVMTSWRVTAADGLSWDQPGLKPAAGPQYTQQGGSTFDPTDLAHQEDEWAMACPTCGSDVTQRTGPHHRFCTECGNTFTPFIEDEKTEHAIADRMPGHPVMSPKGHEGFLPPETPRHTGSGQHESFMPGAPGGAMPGGVCSQCSGPLQGDGSCAGCERSAVAPGAPGIPAVPSVPQGPNGGRPTTMMEPGGANPSRPPQSRAPGTAYASVPTVDPETGAPLDPGAQKMIAHLLANAASEEGDTQPEGTSVREAGAHFSPNDQRELIDETGEARNADKLDLSGTHYPQKTSPSEDYLFGL